MKMTNRFSVLVGSAVLAAGIALGTVPAQAASLSFSIGEFTGSNAEVDFLIQDTTGGVKITATVDPSSTGNTGDFGGVWFNLADQSLINNLTIQEITGDITAIDQSGSVNKVGSNNNNLNGGGSPAPLDVGIAFGSPGASGGIVSSVMFNVLGSGLSADDFAGQTFAARLQTVGAPPNGGNGSSKLAGPAGLGAAVPEPLTMLGVGAAAGFGAFFKKRLAKAQNKNI